MCFLSGKELAARLGVSEKHVDRLRLRGALPFIKLGRLYRYDLEGVLAFINSQERRINANAKVSNSVGEAQNRYGAGKGGDTPRNEM